MSNSTQQLKAQQRRQQFANLLRDMFQLNQPELDFGLYRIMHARKDDINRFIEKDLPRITQDAFASFASADKSQIEQELEKATQQAKALEVDPDSLPKVQELKVKLADNFDLAREEGEVYDALVTFFNRYYSEGDFLSRRVYKDGTYAIPYQGEEVVLHWANKDQYYIKSSETLRDYSFRLSQGAPEGENPQRVHFKLVDAEAGAKDNNKEGADSKRVFVLDSQTPFEIIEGEPNEDGEVFPELQLRFHFRAATSDDWTEASKRSATAAAQKKPPTQDLLRAIAVESLLAKEQVIESTLPEEWKTLLAQPYKKSDGNLADYSMLQGQLNNYTKKNSFDYFIHKDLGGFLTREMDFYIKNELLDWTDIATLKNDPARLAPLLSKIEVIRTLGEKIIAFLAQLENFQKKLWLKKKFVTETNYCITLDRLQAQPELLKQVFDNPKQREDWQGLYKLDLDQLAKDLESELIETLLEQSKYRYLMLDTAHFEQSFKAQLVATMEDLDQECDGLLVHSENFQALKLLQERYRERVKCIYIDPPYNTGEDDFIYRDGYKDSSWLSLIDCRLDVSKSFLEKDWSSIWINIDDNEAHNLKLACDSVFGKDSFIAANIWQKRYSRENRQAIGDVHDYIYVYSTSPASFKDNRKKVELTEKQAKVYTNPNADPKGRWRTIPLTAQAGHATKEQFYELTAPGGKTFVPPEGRCWGVSKATYDGYLADGRIYFGRDNNSQPNLIRYLSEVEGITPWTWWNHEEVGHTDESKKELYSILGRDTSFTTPKPSRLMERIVHIATEKDSLVMDFFSGSGTTAHGCIKQNRKDGGARKYIQVEMGEYFDKVLKPRVQKIAYSNEWNTGEAVLLDDGKTDGVSHAFKYIRLESYDDSIGNLTLHRPLGQQQLLESEENYTVNAARQSYVMNYMLDVETRDSQSLLNTQQFLEPNRYELKVRSAGGDETKSVNVDLLETFNYLLGLTVEHIAAPIHFDAELSQGEFGRWQAKVKRNAEGLWWFRTVFGTNRNGQKVLVVWRNLPSVIDGTEHGIQYDNAVLDAVLIEKLAIRLTESLDDEIDILYVNGDHNIAIPRDRKGQPMEQARLQLIEETFHRLMFADTESVQ